MKPTLTFLFPCLFYCLTLQAQSDWQLFRPGVQYLYGYPDASDLESSVIGIKAGADPCMEMYNTLQLHFFEPDCYEVTPSFMGREVCQTADETRLLLADNAHLVIRQTASPGENWVAYVHENDTIKARVSFKQNMQFLGLTDSVKSILFYRQHGSGPPEYVPVPDRPILISKHYGLIHTFRFSYFPLYIAEGSTTQVPLIGMSEPRVGLQNPGLEDIFTLQVGDELHILETFSSIVYDQQGEFAGSGSWRTFLKGVITEVTTPEPSKLRYTFSGQQLRTKKVGPPTSTYEVFPVEDIAQTWEYDLEDLAYLDLQPGTAIVTPFFDEDDISVVSIANYGFCNKVGKHLRATVTGDFDCYRGIIDGDAGYFFVEGLAGPYHTTNSLASSQTRHIVYFHSDTTECGTPLDFDQITATHETIANLDIAISPNPTSGQVTLQLPEGLIADLKLYDGYGRMLLTANQASGNVDWNMAHLPAGTYQASAWQHGKLLWRGTLLKI